MHKLWLSTSLSLLACAGTSFGQVTQVVSVASSGAQAQNSWSATPAASSDARYIVFLSDADNLVAGDTNTHADVFVRDRLLGTTEKIPPVLQTDADSRDSPAISADGRFVAFTSAASNITMETIGVWYDVYIADRQLGVIRKVSRVGSSDSFEANGDSEAPSISADGRYVVYMSQAQLVASDTNNRTDVYLYDRLSETNTVVSLAHDGAQGNDISAGAAISPDGRYVVFSSLATNLVPGDTNGLRDIFVRDVQGATTVRVSVSSAGVEGDGQSRLGYFKNNISEDGRIVVFQSLATNLVAADTNLVEDLFTHNVGTGVTRRISVASGGVQGNGASGDGSISADARFVVFRSAAANLVPSDTNHADDVFVHDRQSGTTERVNLRWDGQQSASNDEFYSTRSPWISADGRYVLFGSLGEDYVPDHDNNEPDVFLRDRFGGTEFTSLCEPGVSGVMSCPCANPSGGFGQGCDNSSSTGGALLSASGGASLSSDSLEFTSMGERPTALSIVLQGNAFLSSGVVYGQGVRCVGGTLKRLFVKTASGGIVTAPDFGAGDPSVSARSAAKGDPIQGGASRWYLVYYRDGQVLGGCPSTSTFNATQTGRVVWSP